jgi:nucleotide-binding universal stress UspA family protein
MFRSILVPLDGSVFGERALPLALGVARRAGAALHLAHVHSLPGPLYVESVHTMENTLDPQARRRAREYLDGLVTRLAAESPVPVGAALLETERTVADALMDHVLERRPDLVVMTTHGRGPLSRFWLGGVADELLRRLPVPLLLVRPPEGKPDPAIEEAAFRRILVPLDGSALAEQALGPATTLGGLMGAEFTLLEAVEPLTFIGDELGGFAPDVDQSGVLAGLEEQARAYLDGVARRLRAGGLAVQTRVAGGKFPTGAILEAAREGKADLIALATHGRGGVSRLLLGSVADKVVRGASTPVLVFRPIDPAQAP